MARDDADFLRRWSRRKREAAAVAPAAPPEATGTAAPAVPPLDSLTFESDFKAFMHSKVEETVKRAALKKLFSDPHFNLMDGLDIYIDDYTKNEGISEEMLKTLDHARSTLFPPQLETAQAEAQAPAAEPQAGKDDGPARKDDGPARQDA